MALSSSIQRLAPIGWIFSLSLLFICDFGLSSPVDHAKKLCAEGVELARQNRIDEAIDKFNSAVEANPRDGEAYIYLANAYLQVSNLDAAEAACQQAKQFRIVRDTLLGGFSPLADEISFMGNPSSFFFQDAVFHA